MIRPTAHTPGRSLATALGLLCACLLASPRPAGSQEGSGAGAEQDLSADAIIDRALETNTLGFQRGEAYLSVIIQDEHGDLRERRLHIRALREGDPELSRALVRILAPADVAGQAYLFVENDGRPDDVWIYLPAIDDAPRRVAGSQKDEPFLGTNITYSDLESRDIRDGQAARLPDETIAGFDVFVIDAVPDENAPETSAYSRVRLWIRASDFVPLRVRFFEGDGDVAKTLFTEQVDTHQGRTYVRRMTMVDAQDVSTTVVVEAIDFEAQISATELTRETMTR